MDIRIMMVRHADGTTEYMCRNCGEKMIWEEDVYERFTAGSYDQSGSVYIRCPKCGEVVEEKEIHEPEGA